MSAAGAPAAGSTVDAVVVGAMIEELRPFLRGESEPVELPIGTAHRVRLGSTRAVVVHTGIGLVNAAAVTAVALTAFAPRLLLSSGSAGGLATGICVGDVVVGTRFAYFDADATAFGYQSGQVPGMPLDYTAGADIERAVQAVRVEEQRIRPGMVVSGNSFVASHNVTRVREVFPRALAVDMESAAHAQVAHLFGVHYVSVRGISDLCGPAAGTDHSVSLDEVSDRAAQVARELLRGLQ